MCSVPIPLLVSVIPAGVVRQHLLKRGDGVPLIVALDLAANNYDPSGVVHRYLRPAVQVKDRVVRVAADLGDENRGAFEVALQLDCVHGESPFKGCLPSGVRVFTGQSSTMDAGSTEASKRQFGDRQCVSMQ